MIISLFLFSLIPIVNAETSIDIKTDTSVSTETPIVDADVSAKTSARVETSNEVKDPRKNHEEGLRKFNNAKSEYLALKEQYNDAKDNFLDARQKYITSKDPNDLENALQEGRTYLLTADDSMISFLNALITYVENEPTLTGSEKNEIINELNSNIVWLEDKKDEINNAETSEQLASIGREFQAKWHDIRLEAINAIGGRIVNAKINWLVNRFEKAADKVEKEIEKLKEQGKDTSELEIWLDDFNQHIELAKEKHKEAQDSYAEIKYGVDADAKFRKGQELTKEASQYLRDAANDLRKIVNKLREE